MNITTKCFVTTKEQNSGRTKKSVKITQELKKREQIELFFKMAATGCHMPGKRPTSIAVELLLKIWEGFELNSCLYTHTIHIYGRGGRAIAKPH